MPSLNDLQNYAIGSAQSYGVPPNLLLWQIGQESGWDSNARNGNALGLGQFMPGTWAQFGQGSRTDPYASIDAAAAYDSYLFGKFGDWSKVMQSYGTLANVPQKVWDGFNKVMNNSSGGSISDMYQNAVSGFGVGGNSSNSSSGPDSLLTRGAFLLLGVVVIAGAIFVYRR